MPTILFKEDDRAIFTASSRASQAADYLRAFSNVEDLSCPATKPSIVRETYCGNSWRMPKSSQSQLETPPVAKLLRSV
jgi:hypothetical protein